MRKAFCISVSLIILLGACNKVNQNALSSKVEIKTNSKGYYRLFVNGKEFYVKGAGLDNDTNMISELSVNGANSFRTWHTGENPERVLDLAHENGLMVLMGIWVSPERHGFDYSDTLKVQEQFESIKKEVERLKDHPALLGWAIGNELNLEATDLKVYKAVNEISKMIHVLDGNHPTTTTLAGISKKETDYIKEHCSDIDFLSVQLYGSIVHLQKMLQESEWDRPYMVTEWGATGHWEVGKTEWNAPIEPTSQQKAESFIYRYNVGIAVDSFNCLGSYVFLWGQKQERTPTWYGMFLENYDKTETVDAMYYLWNGEWPENRCPTIDSLKLNNQIASDNIVLKIGDVFSAQVFTKDFEGDTLIYRWEIIPESTDLGVGGDFESRPKSWKEFESESEIYHKAPEIPGQFRLFIYVSDPNNQSATANIPFLVEK